MSREISKGTKENADYILRKIEEALGEAEKNIELNIKLIQDNRRELK